MIFLPYVDFMFQYDLRSQSWTQMKMEKRLKNPDTISFIPAERAFHSAQILGNYMVYLIFFTSFCKTFHRNILISIIFSYSF